MNFNFNFGNKKPDKKQLIIVSVVISLIVSFLSQCTGVSENKFWDFLDEIQRKYFPQGIVNELIIQDPEKLDRRIKRDVDKAIEQVTPEYDKIIEEADKKYKPIYSEKEVDSSVCTTEECQSLGGEMRICAPWITDCAKEDE